MDAVTPAAAAAQGLTLKMLRSNQWSRFRHGIYLPKPALPQSVSLADECRWLSAILPGGAAFSGLTAAALHGWWLPPLPKPLPLFVTVEPGGARPDRRGVQVRRAPLANDVVVSRDGVPITSPMRTLLDLAEVLSIVDLVVILDGALYGGAVSLDALQVLAEATKGRRGIRVLRRATELAHPGSESPYESVLRLEHVLCEIPVDVQVRIFDELGEFIAKSDLRIRGTRRLPEYDGASHRSRQRHEDDLQREKLLARAGYERYGYIARELLMSPHVIIQDAEQALGLAHQPLRVDGWLAEFHRSLFSRSARARWARRWC
jgi:very-short-patch-repair endonuclease